MGSNPYGAYADNLASRMFAGAVSALEVLQRHTLFGFYSRSLNEHEVTSWARDLGSGHLGVFSRHIIATGTKQVPPEPLRWCVKCAQQDFEGTGIPVWRVLHQFSFILQCPDHWEPLVSYCVSCSSAFEKGNTYRLPGDSCRMCGNLNPKIPQIKRSVGLDSFTKMCDIAFRGELTGLHPDDWASLVHSFVAAEGGKQVAIGRISDMLIRRWNVESLEAIGQVVRFPFMRSTIESEMGDRPHHMFTAQKLIILDAMRAIRRETAIETDPTSISCRDETGNIPIFSLERPRPL